MSANNFNLEEQWKQIYSTVIGLQDRLGKGVDPLIVQTVTGLRAHGFQTLASCQGHIEWGTGTPWVDISHTDYQQMRATFYRAVDMRTRITQAPDLIARKKLEDELLDEINDIEDSVADQMHQVIKSVFDVLARFNAAQDMPFENQLTVRAIGATVIRVENQGAILQKSKSNRNELRLSAFQQVMEDFGGFLKATYLEQYV